MTRRIAGRRLPQEVQAIVVQTKASSPDEAVRLLAREVLSGYLDAFGAYGPPINVEALASYRSIRTIQEPPSFSEDAELLPAGDRGVLMRVNRERPLTRQRFSIGHEIGHTLFPGYDTQVQCRKPRQRDWHDPNDVLEYLCDVASSEFLFPLGWFTADLESSGDSADGLLGLAAMYKASPEATVRRFIDLTPNPAAAIFFRWKLKPSERPLKSARGQKSLPGVVGLGPVPKLRVEYSVSNESFKELGHHVPVDKSVHDESVIYQAAATGSGADASREFLDLGAFSGWFSVKALPLFTQEAHLGPSGESGVVGIIQPAKKPRSR